MGRGQGAPAIVIKDRIYKLLLEESQKRTIKSHHYIRTRIILRSSVQGGGHAISKVERDLGISNNTVKVWRSRWISSYNEILIYEKGINDQVVSDSALISKILSCLEDAPRSGAPKTFTMAQTQQIVALACQKPEEHGIEMTTWTHEMLAHVAISKGIVKSISSRYVGELLKKKSTSTA
jgi:putative transposase